MARRMKKLGFPLCLALADLFLHYRRCGCQSCIELSSHLVFVSSGFVELVSHLIRNRVVTNPKLTDLTAPS
ncbi:hypothetical protein BDP67DRAFT_510694 [Colletotrichum lupini]|nr:hypothetical protein BDP67DRAFT_510694 [Colletotrichum lupini]